MIASRRRFLLISNPIAGRAGRRLLAPVVAELERAGAVVTRAPAGGIDGACGAIEEAAGNGTVDAVIVAGGDGTFRMAATALLGTSMPIGLLPLGTGNVLAHELALPRDPHGLAQTLLHGPAKFLRAARANGQPFFLMAGAGFDGDVIGRLDHHWKHRLGKLAYLPPALRALSARLPQLAIEIDGGAHEASWVIIANARCYGGAFVLVPHTHAFDEGLHAVIFRSRDRKTLARQLLALAQGQLLGSADVTMLPCRHVSVRSAAPVSVQIDGDAAGTTPLHISPSDDGVLVIVPESMGSRPLRWLEPAGADGTPPSTAGR